MKKMKKILFPVVLGLLSTQANATNLDFNDGKASGGADSFVEIDLFDFAPDLAAVTQRDTDLSGDITGAESFTEMGTALDVSFNNNNLPVFGTGINSSYQLWLDYLLTGTVTGTATGATTIDIDVDFSSGSVGLYLDQDGTIQTSIGGTAGVGTMTKLVDFGFSSGSCDIGASINATTGAVTQVGTGSCNVQLTADVLLTDYLFTTSGVDLESILSPLTAELEVTVQDLGGLNFLYSSIGATQDFNITHDGNLNINVPEPTSIALLGLGLLGLGASSRKKRV